VASNKKSLAPTAAPPQLKTQSAAPTAAAPKPAASDPRGYKQFIAWCIACYLFPYEDGTDLNQDISGNATTNPDTLALDINYYAYKLSKQYGYTWKPVAPSDAKALTTVQTLEDLVVKNLTDPTIAATASSDHA
jgi:hypothetical protein